MYSNVAQGLLFHVWLKSCSEVALLELVARTPHTATELRSSWELLRRQRVNAKSKPETRGSITFRSSPCLSENTKQQERKFTYKGFFESILFGYFLASISSTPNGKLEMHTSLQAPITLMHSWPMKKKLLQFNYEKGKLNFDVKTIEFLL